MIDQESVQTVQLFGPAESCRVLVKFLEHETQKLLRSHCSIKNRGHFCLIIQALKQCLDKGRLSRADLATDNNKSGSMEKTVFEMNQGQIVLATQIEISWIGKKGKRLLTKSKKGFIHGNYSGI
ncbi:hypothetical protein ES703_83960 [subsurface metagenome]